MLRREDAEPTLAPQPSLRHAALARAAHDAPPACPWRCAWRASERELPAGLDVTAYRVIQDALGAAREHGGAGRADVRVRFRADTLEIVVRDDGAVRSARAR